VGRGWVADAAEAVAKLAAPLDQSVCAPAERAGVLAEVFVGPADDAGLVGPFGR
jgi:hypothetical protein